MKVIHKLNDDKFLELMSKTEISRRFEEIPIEAGPFLPTDTEKTWLNHFLKQPEADAFLTEETKHKLSQLLIDQQEKHDLSDYVIEKGKPDVTPGSTRFLSELRQLIQKEMGMLIAYTTKNGDIFEEDGIPHKLMFNIAKKQWYVWWLRTSPDIDDTQRKRLTPLSKIEAVSPINIHRKRFETMLAQLLPSYQDKRVAKLLWKPLYPNMDVQRVFHAFSSFEKEVYQDEDTYQVHVHYYPDEEKYLLSKIRLFGPHLVIQSPNHLKEELLDSVKKALANYQ